MIEVGDKVYVWEEDDFFARDWDNIVGDVVEVNEDEVLIKSVYDGQTYSVRDLDSIFLVGTGPIMNAKIRDYAVEEIFQDIESDPENTLMTIPRPICVQLGLDIGDTLVVEYGDNGGLILRKKESEFTKEYEDIRAQAIEDIEPYDPDNPEGC